MTTHCKCKPSAKRESHRQIRIWLLAVIIFGGTPAGFGQNATNKLTQSGNRSTRVFITKIESTLPGSLDEYSVPGATVALIRGGKVVWTEGFGFADLSARIPMTTETEFNVGSLSKTPTAWAIMQMVDDGKLKLDAPVDTYLRRWHLPPSSFDNNEVTIGRLLSHTAGISEHGYHGWDPTSPLPPIEDSLAGKTGTGAVQVVSTPGAAHHYSGANYTILALVIEEISGRPFSAYMESQIFRPLHMLHANYGIPTDFEKSMAKPYDALENPLPILRYNELAAAGLTTNIHDLANFAAGGLKSKTGAQPGRGLVRPETIAEMQSPQPNTKWANEDPFGPSPQYGYGYTVRPEQFAGKTGVGHGGTNKGWEGLLQIIPSTGDGIVILTNSSNGSAVIASVLCDWRQWAAGTNQQVPCPAIEGRIPLLRAYRSGGTAAAVSLYRRLRQNESAKYDFSSFELNSLGYQVMRMGDVAGAIEIFKLNVDQFPQEWNVYDSLGEAYLKLGNKPEAIKNYKRSLELNPNNDNGRGVLKSLGAQSITTQIE
jgi:CubicO group peptidase (beta-lactamase class C family)